jgi:hypothetical protein
MVRSLQAMTSSQLKRDQKEDKKKSMLSRLSPEGGSLFKLLSAKNWKDGNPKLPAFTKKILEDRDSNRAIGEMKKISKSWSGKISEKGMFSFLANGHAADGISDAPGGFSVFMFSPLGAHKSSDQKSRILQVRTMFRSAELDEDSTKYFAKNDFYLADNLPGLEEQIHTCIKLIEKLTCKDGIASEGYRHGFEMLGRCKKESLGLTGMDPLFPVKFAYLLDRAFQNFVLHLRDHHNSEDPRKGERGPTSDNDPGHKSYLRRRGEAELKVQKRLPGSHNQKRSLTDQMDKEREGWKPKPMNPSSSNKLASASRCSERLNEKRDLVEEVPRKRAIGNDGARPEKNEAEIPQGKGQANNELPTALAKVRRSRVEAEEEDEVANKIETDKPKKLADQRNLKRVDKADEIDQSLMSKHHLPESIDEFLPNVIPGPDGSFVPPAWLMQATEEVAEPVAPTPLAPPVRFDLSEDSVRFNSELLRESDLDLGKFLAQHQDTTRNFGSEFRPIGDLEKILGLHPNFGFFSGVLADGMDHRLAEELPKEQRKEEVEAMMTTGNHQSVQEDSEEVAKLLAKDVLCGFSLPVLPELLAPDLARAMVQPAGVAKQFSLQDDGSRKLKRRLTQDLSFPLTSPTASANKRIDMEGCVEMIYGWCLSRVTHFIVALRLAYPSL